MTVKICHIEVFSEKDIKLLIKLIAEITNVYLLSLFSIGTTARVGFGLSKNIPPFFPICHQLSPSSHS
jgi:hypothetical protein